MMPATPTTSSSTRFLAGFVVLWMALYALGATTGTGIETGPLAALVVVALAVAVQRRLLGVRTRGPATDSPGLGLRRPTARSLVAAAVTSTAVVGGIATYVWINGLDVHLRNHWLWLSLCLLAYHGIAEETVWRGYAFGHLRRNRPFGRAVIASTPLLAATHVPILVESGPTVGTVAVVVAAITCLPLSHLYEISGGTIWPGALVHAAIDGFKLLQAPESAVGFSIAVAVLATFIPLLVFAWHHDRLVEEPHPDSPTTQA